MKFWNFFKFLKRKNLKKFVFANTKDSQTLQNELNELKNNKPQKEQKKVLETLKKNEILKPVYFLKKTNKDFDINEVKKDNLYQSSLYTNNEIDFLEIPKKYLLKHYHNGQIYYFIKDYTWFWKLKTAFLFKKDTVFIEKENDFIKTGFGVSYNVFLIKNYSNVEFNSENHALFKNDYETIRQLTQIPHLVEYTNILNQNLIALIDQYSLAKVSANQP